MKICRDSFPHAFFFSFGTHDVRLGDRRLHPAHPLPLHGGLQRADGVNLAHQHVAADAAEGGGATLANLEMFGCDVGP